MRKNITALSAVVLLALIQAVPVKAEENVSSTPFSTPQSQQEKETDLLILLVEQCSDEVQTDPSNQHPVLNSLGVSQVNRKTPYEATDPEFLAVKRLVTSIKSCVDERWGESHLVYAVFRVDMTTLQMEVLIKSN
jgi:hypothetical protein